MDIAELMEVGLSELLLWSLIFMALTVLAYLVYRSIEKPRLALTPTPDGPRARRRDVILWVITTPLLIFFWWNYFFTVLWITDNSHSLAQLLLYPLAIIIAVRTLAFIMPPAAHELAKILPLAIVALILLSGNLRDYDEMLAIGDQVMEMDVTLPAYIFLFAYEYFITAIWYWGWIRWGQPRLAARRAGRLVEQVAHDDGGVAVLPDTDGANGRT